VNADEAIKRACEEPTLAKALNWIAMWENDRAVKQALEWKRTGVSTASHGGGWDTCFEYLFQNVLEQWKSPAPKLPIVKPWIIVFSEDGLTSLNSKGQSLFGPNDESLEEDVLAIVVDVQGSMQAAIERAKSVPRGCNGVVVFAAIGPGPGQDMSELSKLVDGVVLRPPENTFEAWNTALQPILISIKHPEYKDTLDPSETQGSVSREEFEETIRRTNAP